MSRRLLILLAALVVASACAAPPLASADTSGPSPVVTGVAPASGRGGDTVVISGTGFTGTSLVAFGRRLATFTVDSDTQITATAPASTTTETVDVRVATSSGGASSASAADEFTYLADLPPALSTTGSVRAVKRGRTVLVFPGATVDCPTGGLRCAVSVTARAATGRQLRVGTASLHARSDSTLALSFFLDAAAQKRLRGTRSKLDVTFSAHRGTSPRATAVRTVTVRVPR